ncbi:MAG: hypothetical protein QOK59_07635 [Nitrososphaeraceae archaeon]|jgi:hypothetical protein|nr:hypothetical protein [Nitrososphaeraceae archaeon]MDW0148537.1 hypothetical protein [Nitrososphaeraceae archaeon]MDW0154447.1 hypothetical protein [Nitrososphaeraceae archaeon]MDW0156702.1 hypothetical protein [Nitrososphaeraceae archaeon]MDW3654603.1 hypothetical protein [Nitrososphaeraceae archaeon]
MKYVRMNLFILVIILTFILVPSFALISSSQSNDTSDETLSNETSFSSLSRELAENQSQSDDESDQEADD